MVPKGIHSYTKASEKTILKLLIYSNTQFTDKKLRTKELQRPRDTALPGPTAGGWGTNLKQSVLVRSMRSQIYGQKRFERKTWPKGTQVICKKVRIFFLIGNTFFCCMSWVDTYTHSYVFVIFINVRRANKLSKQVFRNC